MYGGQIEKEFQVASINRNQQIERHPQPHVTTDYQKSRNRVGEFLSQLKFWNRPWVQTPEASGSVEGQSMRVAH